MNDPSFLAFVEAWNTDQGLDTPTLHKRIVAWLAENRRAGREALLLMAFRNSGKSTLVGLFAAWVLTCRSETRIIVLAADHALAKKMVRNVKRIVERHPMCEGMKPSRADQWAADQFTINRSAELRDPSMLARGVAANVTGSRADIVICDDVEVPNTSNTLTKREDLRQRLDEIDYILVPGGLQLYVGTPHTFDTIYAESAAGTGGEGEGPYLAGFARLKLTLLDDDGRSRWPERFTAEKIAAIRRRTGPNKFRSQMMLDPVDIADGRLDVDQLCMYDAELDYREGNSEAVLSLGGRRLVSASCWWDPAYGAPGKGDGSVVASVFTCDRGDYWLHRVRYLEHDPALLGKEAEAVQLCRQVARFLRSHHLPSVIVETNGIGRFLPGLLRAEIANLGVAAGVVEKASHGAKDKRIIDAFDAVLAAGRLHAHRSLWDTPFIGEMREWRPGPGGRDDGLDAVSGCLLNEPVRLSRRPHDSRARPRTNWRPGGGDLRAVTDFGV